MRELRTCINISKQRKTNGSFSFKLTMIMIIIIVYDDDAAWCIQISYSLLTETLITSIYDEPVSFSCFFQNLKLQTPTSDMGNVFTHALRV